MIYYMRKGRKLAGMSKLMFCEESIDFIRAKIKNYAHSLVFHLVLEVYKL